MYSLILLAILAVLGTAWSYPQDVYYDYSENIEHEEDYSELTLPKFAVEHQTFTVQEGGDVDISCAVDGRTPYVPIVRRVVVGNVMEDLLFVGDVKVTLDSKLEIDSGIVTIRNVERNDAGKYICYFETEPVVEVHHKVDVQYAPSISSPTPQNQTVAKGTTITLECEAHGNPISRITWSRDGGDIPYRIKEEEGRSSSWSRDGGDIPYRIREEEGPSSLWQSITLLVVDGQTDGRYTCKADNGVGAPAIKDMDIAVEYTPENNLEKIPNDLAWEKMNEVLLGLEQQVSMARVMFEHLRQQSKDETEEGSNSYSR